MLSLNPIGANGVSFFHEYDVEIGKRPRFRPGLLAARGRYFFGDSRNNLCRLCRDWITDDDRTLIHDDGECNCAFHVDCMKNHKHFGHANSVCPACSGNLMIVGEDKLTPPEPFMSSLRTSSEALSSYWEARDNQLTHLGEVKFLEVPGYQEQNAYRADCYEALLAYNNQCADVEREFRAHQDKWNNYFGAKAERERGLRDRRLYLVRTTFTAICESNDRHCKGSFEVYRWALRDNRMSCIEYETLVTELGQKLRQHQQTADLQQSRDMAFAHTHYQRAIDAILREQEQVRDLLLSQLVERMKGLKGEYHASLDEAKDVLNVRRTKNDGYRWERNPPDSRSNLQFD